MFSEIPECGLVQKSTETKPREGDNVTLQFYTNEGSGFHWLDGKNKILNITGSKYVQKRLGDLDYMLVILKVQEAHAGDYKVQCRSGRQSNSVRIEVLGKYVKKLLNLFMGFKVGNSSSRSFFFSSQKYKCSA